MARDFSDSLEVNRSQEGLRSGLITGDERRLSRQKSSLPGYAGEQANGREGLPL